MIEPDRHVTRTGEDYAEAMQSLLPLGQAWPRDQESMLMQVVRGLTRIWGDVERRASDLLEQESDPRITLELLQDWERNWGLPDPCYSEPQTIGERQQALIMRMTMLGAQSRDFFIKVAAQIGYSITITEYRVWVVGLDRCGDSRVFGELPPDPMRNEWGQPIMDARGDHPVADGELSGWPQYGLGPPANRFYWTVHLDDARLVWFRTGWGGGQTGVDPHLRISMAEDLKCLLDRWKPAHTEIIFDYSSIEPPFVTLSGEKKILESAAIGTVVGTFFVENKYTGTPVFSLTDNAGGKFSVTGTGLTVASPLNFEAAASHTVMVAVSGIDPPIEGSAPFTVEVINVPEPQWVTVFNMGLNTAYAGGLVNYNLRQSILAGYFPKGITGTQIRLTLAASGGAEGTHFDGLFVGHAAVGSLTNFNGNQKPVTQGGQAAFTIPPGGFVTTPGVLVTDPIIFAFDSGKDLIVSMHFDSAGADATRYGFQYSGVQHFLKTGASEVGNTTVAGYTDYGEGYLFTVTKIEVLASIL